MTRRWFSVAAVWAATLALVGAACYGSSAAPPPTPTPSPTPTPTATPTPTPSPTPTPTPVPPPSVELTVVQPKQGGFLEVRLDNPPPGMAEAVAVFAGGSYPMAPDGEGWLGVIGVPTDMAVGDYPLEVFADGVPVGALTVSVLDGGYPRLSLTVEPGLFDLLLDTARIEEERQLVQQTYQTYTPERLWDGDWLIPAEGEISNPFGVQRSFNGGPYSMHTGTDIAGPGGTPIVATGSGRVVLSQELYLLGNSVIVDHGMGLLTGYHHLQSIAVEVGAEVVKGDLVGYMGTTGFSTGNHLHWEARVHGVLIDPIVLIGEASAEQAFGLPRFAQAFGGTALPDAATVGVNSGFCPCCLLSSRRLSPAPQTQT